MSATFTLILNPDQVERYGIDQIELTAQQINSLRGRLGFAAGGGRPRKPRCVCGLYTLNVAERRKHTCPDPNSFAPLSKR